LFENSMFDFTHRHRQREASPDAEALSAFFLGWKLMVGRDRRPIGIHLSLGRTQKDTTRPLNVLLDEVLQGLVLDNNEEEQFPRGLILLGAQDLGADEQMSSWSAPRNVLLEVGQADLDDEGRRPLLYDIQRQGVRFALRLDGRAGGAPERLPGIQYVLTPKLPPPVDTTDFSVLTWEGETPARVEAAFAAGAHAVVGWPLQSPSRREPRGLSPAQTAVFELIRLVQADADVRDLERVFKGEPLLAYLLLTLANSTAFRRPAPVSSLGHAISLLGYQRLIKWLVLLLAIAGKDKNVAPLVFTAVVRGYLMENLSRDAGRSRSEQDEAFVAGAFSLLDVITGQSLSDLMQGVHLSEQIVEALLAGAGSHAVLLEIVRRFETGDSESVTVAQAHVQLPPARSNRALLQAVASADALQSLI
jgi:HDOD domain